MKQALHGTLPGCFALGWGKENKLSGGGHPCYWKTSSKKKEKVGKPPPKNKPSTSSYLNVAKSIEQ